MFYSANEFKQNFWLPAVYKMSIMIFSSGSFLS